MQRISHAFWKRAVAFMLSVMLVAGCCPLAALAQTEPTSSVEQVVQTTPPEGSDLLSTAETALQASPTPAATEAPDAPQQPEPQPEEVVVSTFNETIPDSFSLAEGFSSTQGPYWFYKWMDKDSGAIGEMRYDASNTRWINGSKDHPHGDHWMRVFPNGMMSGNDGCTAVLEWVAPKDGTILLTAGVTDKTQAGQLIMDEAGKSGRDGATVWVKLNDTTIWGGYKLFRNALAFEPIRLTVKAGDTLQFSQHGNANFNNDRLKWNPVINYENESGVVLSNPALVKNGQLTVDAAGLADGAVSELTLYATLNGEENRTALEVKSASAANGKLTVNFTPVADEAATVQLNLVVGGTSTYLAFETSQYPVTYEEYDFAATYTTSGSPVSSDGVWKYGYSTAPLVGEFSQTSMVFTSGRWAFGSMRIFPNGIMAGTDNASGPMKADGIIQFTAPTDGVVEISAAPVDVSWLTGTTSNGSTVKGTLDEGTISMEGYNRTGRDGVALWVMHNNAHVWPDTGVYYNMSNRQTFPFDPVRVAVKAGDTLEFRVNGKGYDESCKNPYDNDRVFWNPHVKYLSPKSAMLSAPSLTKNGELKVEVANAAALTAEDVTLYAVVDNAARVELPVTAASLSGGVATIAFEEITATDATVQLQVSALGDSATLTFSTSDYPTDAVVITPQAGNNGAIDPAAPFSMSKSGEKVITFVPDAGYEVYKVFVNEVEVPAEEITGNTYTLKTPTGDTTVRVTFKLEGQQIGTTYYVDAVNGDDANPGTSEEQAWQSLDKINATTFEPGDKILLKAGCIWNGYLWPKGEGDDLDVITLGKYGGDGYPIINGNGDMPYDWAARAGNDEHRTPTVFLCDQSNWVIENLEVTANFDNKYNKVGILIYTTGTNGTTDNVTVQECYVHDVTANRSNSKLTGGIIGVGSNNWIDGNPNPGVQQSKLGFNGLYFLNNHVKNVAKEGVRTSGSGTGFREAFPHNNIVISGNYIEEVYGDGIVPAEINSNCVVEYNLIKNPCNVSEANYAGMWGWYIKDTVYRYNEVFGIEYGSNDGEGFDFDLGNSNVSYVYNYSHNNAGGVLLTMSGAGHASNTVAYNVLANNGKPSQQLFHVATANVRIYNNTFYVGKGNSTYLFDSGAQNYFKNNILLVHGDLKGLFSGSGTINTAGFTNNIFYPAASAALFSDEVLQNNIVADPMLSGPSLISSAKYAEAEGVTYENMGRGEEFVAGLRERASIFKLTAGSPAIDAGVAITDSACSLSEDFFGNPIVGSPDIGAHEFAGDAGPTDPDVINAESVRLDQTTLYMLIGDRGTLKSTVLPANALDTSTRFTSSDKAVVSVKDNGTLVAVGEGKAEITAIANSNPAATATCTVQVYPKNGSELIAVKDTFVRQSGALQPGDGLHMEVKNEGNSSYNRKTLISFNIADMPADYASATLRLNIVGMGDISAIPSALYEISDEWDEMAVVWNTAPTEGDKVAEFSVTGLGECNINLAEYLEAKRAAGAKTVSLLVNSTSNIGSQGWYNIGSRESGQGPALVFSNDSILSVEGVQLQSAVGIAPKLPATVKATDLNGKTDDVAVVWEAVDPALYATAGQYSVVGTIEGYSLPVIANVLVSNDIILSLEAVAATTPAGIAPVLPGTVNATFINDDIKAVPVTWADIDQSSYAAPGEFTVQGSVENFAGNVIATVTVTDAEPVDAAALTLNAVTGYEPVLPDTVAVNYTDGSARNETVNWQTPSGDYYMQDGIHNLTGTTASGVQTNCVLTLYSIDAVTVPALENPQGKYPALPFSVDVDVPDTLTRNGSQTISMPVTWDAVPAANYNGTAPYTVNGVLSGTKVSVSIQITQIAALPPIDNDLITIEDVKIQASPSNSNFAGEKTLVIKNVAYDLAYKRDAVVKFDLSKLEGGWQSLTGLTLKLYLTARENYGTESYLSVWASGSNWSEATANWDGITQSSYKLALLAQDVPVSKDQIGSYVEIDVAAVLPYVGNTGLITFALGIEKNPTADPNGDHSALTFAAMENGESTAPKLAVTNRYITAIEVPELKVGKGEKPTLPATISVTWSDGTNSNVLVNWNQTTSSMFASKGTVLVGGMADGVYVPVSAKVKVLDTADFTNLQKAIDDAHKLDGNQGDYTSGSWQALQTLLDEAEAMLGDEDIDQTSADAKTDALNNAVMALVSVTGLKNAIAAAGGKNAADYTKGSWQAFEAALAAANSRLAETNPTAQQLSEAADALDSAAKALVSVTGLKNAIAAAGGKDAADYTKGSWQAFEAALAAANSRLTETNPTAQQLSEAADALDSAAKALVNVTGLKNAIAAAGGKDAADYTKGSWQAFEAALAAANSRLTETNPTAQQLSEAADALDSAAKALVSVTGLKNAIAAAGGKDAADYTKGSWQAFEAALAAANSRLTETNPTAQQLSEAADTLDNAAKALVNVKLLNAAVAEAGRLNSADYTADSWDAVRTALIAASTALNNGSNDTVEQARVALYKAIDSLKRVSDSTGGNSGDNTGGNTNNGGSGSNAPANTETGKAPQPATVPATGDAQTLILWIALLASSLVGLVVLVQRRRHDS